MAKRRSKSNLSLIFGVVAALMGVAALAMIFLTGLSTKEVWGFSAQHTGIQLAFGYSETVLGSIKVEVLNFNFVILLTYLLPLLAGIFAAVPTKSMIVKVLPIILFVIAAIAFFIMPQFYSMSVPEASSDIDYASIVNLGIGAIIGGILSIVGAACSAIRAVVK